MGDWADEKALAIITKYVESHSAVTRITMLSDNGARHLKALLDDIADALRQAEARARTRENEKCRELIGARVGATQ